MNIVAGYVFNSMVKATLLFICLSRLVNAYSVVQCYCSAIGPEPAPHTAAQCV